MFASAGLIDVDNRLSTMLDEIDSGNLKSLIKKIYWLCLEKPRSTSELSNLIYNDKLMLSKISPSLNLLVHSGLIERLPYTTATLADLSKSRSDLENLNEIDKHTLFWKSVPLPIEKHIERKNLRRNDKMHSIDTVDKKVIDTIIESSWFRKNFLDNQYMCLFIGRGVDVANLKIRKIIMEGLAAKMFISDKGWRNYLNEVSGGNLNKLPLIFSSINDFINITLGDLSEPLYFLNIINKDIVEAMRSKGEKDDKLRIGRREIIKKGFDEYLADRKGLFSDEFTSKVNDIKEAVINYVGEEEVIETLFRDNASYLLPDDIAEIFHFAGRSSSIVWPIIDKTKEVFGRLNNKELSKLFN